jgi:uncharacterized protein YraI
MRQFWFKIFWGVTMVTSLSMGLFLAPRQAEAYQVASTPTGVLVTVTYTDPINVRSGPSTIYYPIVGQLSPGDVVPALGISPGHEWIQVSYPGGTGWVYASFVSISGGELQIVEPPPTPTLVTVTINPTLAAAFNVQPTQTHMPTFTPPPPLDVPQFTDAESSRASGMTSGVFIISLGLIGAIGLLVSYFLRKS